MPLVDRDDQCQGWVTALNNDYVESYDLFGKTCYSSSDTEKVYTTFDEPQTCAERYLRNPESYIEAAYGFDSCHTKSDYAQEGCMTIEAMKTYYKEYEENDWWDGAYSNPYLYNSCLYPEGGDTAQGQHYRDCCFRQYRETVIGDKCEDYTEGNCPCGCLDFDIQGASPNPNPGNCYDPVNATIVTKIEEVAQGGIDETEFSIQWCVIASIRCCHYTP